jgi:hypothetical protein
MKRRVLFGVIATMLILTSLAVIASCTSTPAGTTTLKLSDADYQSAPNGILEIRNSTNFDVGIFVGKVERGTFIGAIRARQARNFDITKISGLPPKGAFLFRATSMTSLNNKGLVGITEEDVLYTGLVAYDLTQPDRRISRDIFARIDETQETFIYVANVSKYMLQLRIDSSDGEVVAVLSPGQRNKKLWIKMQEDGLPYRFFPTYVYVNPNTGEMDAFTDEVNKTGPRFEPAPKGSDVQVITFNDPATQPGGKQYNIAFVRLQNDTNGLLSFETAQGMYKKNTRGTVNTRQGNTDVYEIAADTGDAGRTYTNMGVEHDAGHLVFAPPVTVRPGYEYTIVVTNMNGNYQYDYYDNQNCANESKIKLLEIKTSKISVVPKYEVHDSERSYRRTKYG